MPEEVRPLDEAMADLRIPTLEAESPAYRTARVATNKALDELVASVRAESAAEVSRMREAKDGAYSERNKAVIALAWMSLRAGCRVGVREHEGEWDDDWRAILMIDLPTGQASWHFHDSERPLLAGFPPYPDGWDGHTTDEKYERLAALASLQHQEEQG